jgi:hypothetical protein
MRLLALAGLAVIGCTPLADQSYAGEALFAMAGTFSATRAPIEVDARLALLWQDAETAGGPGIATTPIPFTVGAFGVFRAEVVAVPGERARFTFAADGPVLAEAYLHVVLANPVAPTDQDLGVEAAHVVIHADRDVDGGDAADYLGGPVAAGYHLRRFTTTDQPGAAQRALIDRCVARTGDRPACTAGRAYQLGAVDDAEPLRITLRVR